MRLFSPRSARASARPVSSRATTLRSNIVGQMGITIACRRSLPSWFAVRWRCWSRPALPRRAQPGRQPRQFPSTHLNRPGGNVTGVASLGKVLVAKRFELLHELVPNAEAIAFLVNPNNAVADLDTSDAQSAAAALGQKLIIVKARDESDIDAAFATIARERGRGLLQQLDPFLQSRRDQLVALAARY